MTERERATGLRLLALIAAVAAAYYVTGRLGLLLAIPPGYATAVWPPSGVALAAAVLGGMRVLPGVALGSFALNIATAFDPEAPWRSAMVPAAIALGAAAQAGLGAWLIARFVGYRNVLVQEFAAVRMFTLGGPVACTLNAAVGVGSLLLSGKVEPDTAWLNLGTWWVGDTIGVLIFAPLVLVWSVRPYRDWILHQLFVTVPLAGLFAAVVAMFVFISRSEQARLMAEFERGTRALAREVRKDLGATLNSLNALEGLYASSERVDASEFETFAKRLVAATPAIRGLTWNPVVPAGERARFEAAARAGGVPAYRIEEMDAGGRKVAAGPRPFYVPVRYVAPASSNEAAMGFDAASEPERGAALGAALDAGAATATRRIELVQGGAGMVVYVPLFRDGVEPETPDARRGALQGYIAAVLGIERFMRATESAAARTGWSVQLSDAGPMAATGPRSDAGPEVIAAGGLRHEIQLPFAGRDLRLAFELPGPALLARRSWATWAALAGGLALTGVVGVMLLVGVGREAHTEALVRERTDRLRLSEEALRIEATHDHLTGLPNRALFLDRLEQALQHGQRHGTRFALLYLDIDGFKPVNDQLGHAAGDELLRQIARQLREAVRGEDTVARLGGDEFAVVLAPPQDAHTAMAKADELVAVLGAARTLAAPGKPPAPARVGASVGAALYPQHGQGADELMHAADAAMYEAKRSGKNASRLAG